MLSLLHTIPIHTHTITNNPNIPYALSVRGVATQYMVRLAIDNAHTYNTNCISRSNLLQYMVEYMIHKNTEIHFYIEKTIVSFYWEWLQSDLQMEWISTSSVAVIKFCNDPTCQQK